MERSIGHLGGRVAKSRVVRMGKNGVVAHGVDIEVTLDVSDELPRKDVVDIDTPRSIRDLARVCQWLAARPTPRVTRHEVCQVNLHQRT